MNPVAKLLIFLGAVLVVMGLFWQVASRYLPLGRLPGDLVIERDHTRIYVPIATCILLSVVLSLVASLWRWLGR
jgi:hypothetical protein